MAIDLQGLGAIGFTENQAFNAISNNSVPLYTWIEYINLTGFTIAQQKTKATAIFQEIVAKGGVTNCGGNLTLAQQFSAPLSWVEQITDAIFLVVEQIKNGATPTEE